VTTITVNPLSNRALDNRLINGEFRIWQRGTSLSAQADDTYGGMGDRWYILTQTSTIAGARQSAPFDGARNSGQLTQSQASAQRIGAAQIIENINCQDLRGQAVTFYGRFKCSVDQDIRMAILEWTGTADSVTSDFVLDWTSTTYTAGNFFTTTSTTVTAVKEYASPGTGWVDFFVTGTLGSSLTNICVMVWTEGTLAQNGTLSLANCGLIRGSAAPVAHTARNFAQEVSLCQRYYQKTFPLDTTPAQNAGTTGSIAVTQIVGAAAAQISAFMPFVPPMFTAPTVTFFNTSAANAQIRNHTRAADWTGTATIGLGSNSTGIYGVTTGTSAQGDNNTVHLSAVAEL